MAEHPTPEQDLALSRLAMEGTLTEEQIRAVRAALWAPVAGSSVAGRRPASLLLAEVAGYVGGGLMLGGVALLVALRWDQLSVGGRIALLAVTAAGLVVAGILVAGGPAKLLALRDAPTSVRRRVAGLLLPLSAVPAALIVGTALEEPRLIAWSGTGLLVAVLMYAIVPSIPALLITATMSGLFGGGVADALESSARDRPSDLDQLIVGAFAVVGVLWLVAGLIHLAPPRPLSLTVGAFFLVLASQIAIGHNGLEPIGFVLVFLAGLICLGLYWWERSTLLLAAGVIAISLGAIELVNDATEGALAGPLGLLVGGGVLLGASAFGFWLRSVRERTAVDGPSQEDGHRA